jgi:predicted methyltransferase
MIVEDQLDRRLGRIGSVEKLEEFDSAKPGTGATVASSLHRIEETYTVRDFEKRGFKLIGKSDLLRKPEDKRETVSYTSPGLGHTDRFLLVFRKNGG